MDKQIIPERMQVVRSYVTRAGRLTAGQERALVELWPQFGIEFEPRLLDLEAVFARRAPQVMEIGFGNGDHLAALAQARPECNFLGVEVHRPGVGRLLLSIKQQELGNLRIVRHDAIEVLEQQIPPRSLAEVHILFPDPWPKKRHHKRRLIQAPFAALLSSRLSQGGRVHLATDWQPYAQQMRQVLDAVPELANRAGAAQYMPRPAYRAPTRFERRGERLGYAVWDLEYELK